MLDFLLSACHFLLVFALVAILATRNALIQPGIIPSSLHLTADLDRAYGASTLLLIGVGFGRVYLGCKGLVLFSMESPLLDKDRTLYDGSAFPCGSAG